MPPIPKRDERSFSTAWYDIPKEEPSRVAHAIYSYAIFLEAQQSARRVKYQAMYRLVTGEEPPVQMGLWMSRRSATTNSLATGLGYARPYSNCMRNAGSVLENRIGTVEPFVQLETSGVSFETREAVKQVTEFIDGILDSNRYNGLSRLCFRDMFLYGQTYVKASSVIEDSRSKVIIERIDPTLILVDEVAFRAAFPTDALELRPYRRSEAMALFGSDDPEIERAIRTAPAAFWSGTGQIADDWIFFIEATKLPNAAGQVGRQVLCLQNKVISDLEYKRPRYRWAVGRWEPPSQNFYVNGGAYIACPYQLEINGLDQRIRAGIDHNAFTGFLVPDGAGVSAQTMGSRPGMLWKYQGGKPEQVTPVPFPPQLYEYRKQKEQDLYAALGLTAQNVTGTKPQGVTSGKALRLAVDYSDARNKSLIMSLSELGADVAERIVDEAEECEPIVQTTAVGSQLLDWKEIRKAISRDEYKIKPFPINRYVGTPGEDAQDAADDYANGLIDKRALQRLQSLPDLASYRALATASDDLLEEILDDIVRKARFIAPPQTLDDPAAAFTQTKARYNLEARYARRAPNDPRNRKVLRALFQFLSVIGDRIAHPEGQTLQPPMPAVAAGAPGLGPTAVNPQQAGLPAAPLPQISPANMAPAQLGGPPPAAVAA